MKTKIKSAAFKICPRCGEREMRPRTITKGDHRGKMYFACAGLSDLICDYVEWPKKTDERGARCSSYMH